MKRRHSGIITKIIVMVLIIYAAVKLVSVQTKINEAELARAELEQAVAEKAATNAALEYEINHSGDPETIEDIARNKLGLVLPGERVFYDITG